MAKAKVGGFFRYLIPRYGDPGYERLTPPSFRSKGPICYNKQSIADYDAIHQRYDVPVQFDALHR